MKILHNINQLLNSQNLLGRSVRAGGILTLGSLAENLLRFIRNVILARLLVPEAFGLMAMVLATVAVMEAFTQVGLRQSVIHHKKGSEEGFLNVVWWLSSFRGLILYVIGFLIAPVICDFYQKPEMLPLIRAGFLAILFSGLMSPKVHALEKEMRFKGWVFLMQGSGASGVIVTMVAAFFIQNVWALVLGYMAESFLRSALSFIFYPVIPHLTFEKLFLNDILRFSKKMFGLPILMMLFIQTDVFVIGKVLSMGQLGMYALAKSLAAMPSTFLSRIVEPIVLPTLAQMQDDKAKLREGLLTLTRWATLLGLPFISFLVVFAEPILSIVYGSEYSVAAVPFGLLSVYSLFFLCSSFIMNMYIAIGQPDIHRIASFTRTTLFLIIIYPATKYFGLAGAASSVLVSMFVLLAVQIVYIRRLLHIGYLEYFGTWIEGIKLSLIVILPGYLLNIFIKPQRVLTFVVGIILCITAWSLGIAKMVHLHKKDLAPR